VQIPTRVGFARLIDGQPKHAGFEISHAWLESLNANISARSSQKTSENDKRDGSMNRKHPLVPFHIRFS